LYSGGCIFDLSNGIQEVMKIISFPSLFNFNTFHLPVSAREMAILESEEDFMEIFNRYDLKNQEYLILGEGSNILFTRDFDGLIITSSMNRIRIMEENNCFALIEADAGLNWHSLVQQTISMGYQGLENLSLIPGKVGAAPIQNIGAYGVEIEKFIDSVIGIDLISHEPLTFSKEECRFSYRSSIFKTTYKNQILIRSIRLKLNKIPEYHITYDKILETLDLLGTQNLSAASISRAVVYLRRSKLPDPDKIGNAGSFFKNPVVDKIDYEGLKAEFPDIRGYEVSPDSVKIPAAWLIEQCGWKGKRFKAAGIHHNHALVLVNHGNASGKDLLQLSEKIQHSVSAKFGILLEPEVNII
jgi:UDP-N-acetylmuramate dehydrogenase